MTLTRKTPLKAGSKPMRRTAMKPSKVALARSAIKAGTKALRPRKPRTPRAGKAGTAFRSPELLALVRALPCQCCGRVGHTQAAHSNQLRFGKGRGLKASDAAIMALCSQPGNGMPGCHEQHDQGGIRTKLEAWEFEYRMIARTLLALRTLRQLVGSAELIRALPPLETCAEALAVALVEHIEQGRLQIAQP